VLRSPAPIKKIHVVLRSPAPKKKSCVVLWLLGSQKKNRSALCAETRAKKKNRRKKTPSWAGRRSEPILMKYWSSSAQYLASMARECTDEDKLAVKALLDVEADGAEPFMWCVESVYSAFVSFCQFVRPFTLPVSCRVYAAAGPCISKVLPKATRVSSPLATNTFQLTRLSWAGS
jgi:hypothetical protein